MKPSVRNKPASTKIATDGDMSVLRSSPGKLYLHVASVMRHRLEAGDWPPGSQLPTLTTLAEEFGVANVTIRQAVAILEDEGFVYRQQGRGTFVNDQAPPKPMFSVGLDWPSLLKMITKSQPELIKSRDAALPADYAKYGTLAPAYRYLKRVNTVDGLPCLVTDAYVDVRLYRRAVKKFETETIIPVIEALPGVRIDRCRQILTIGPADIETATLLGIPVNTPMGCVRRILTDPNDEIIYFNDVAYRGDLVNFEIDVYPGR